MKRHDDEAIVLDARLSGEADRYVVLLLASGELLRGVAPSAARSLVRFGGTLQAGARVRVRWTRRAEGAPAILSETQLLAPPPTGDPLERLYATAHLVELVAAFAREGAEDPRAYRLLDGALGRLASGDALDPLARYTEAWVLRLGGLLSDLDACAECGAPLAGRRVALAADTGATCVSHAPAGARVLSPRAATWLASTRNAPPASIPPLDPAVDRELSRSLQGLIRSFTGRPFSAWPALSKLRGQEANANANGADA